MTLPTAAELAAQGHAHWADHRPVEAEAAFRAALGQAPDNLAALAGLAAVAMAAGRRDIADGLYRRALALAPEDGAALHNLGKTVSPPSNAARWLDRAARVLALPEIYDSAAKAWRAVGQPVRAIALFKASLALAPDRSEIWRHLGAACRDARAFAASAKANRRCLRLRPDHGGAWIDLAVALHRGGDIAGSRDAGRIALAIEPRNPEAWWNLSHDLLLNGNFAAGWRAFDWRWHTAGYGRHRPIRRAPDWLGQSTPNAHLWVAAEQGLGDALQFLQLVPAAARRVGRVSLTLPAAALDLAQRGLPANVAVSATAPTDSPDYQCALLSLPRLLDLTLTDLPVMTGYLAARPDRVAQWRERLDKLPRPHIGLVWAGNPAHGNDWARSLPPEIVATLVRAHPGMMSLQLGATALDGLIDIAGAIADLDDTAAILADLDLLITVDTAVAHLAGAMGRPTWLLLPHPPDWRWLLERSDSPWYPRLHLYRQPTPGDWSSVAAAVVRDLNRRGANAG